MRNNKAIKAITIANWLMERDILPLGSPRMLLTDNGREFENELCRELFRLVGIIEKQKTTVYTPSATAALRGGIPRCMT